MVCLNLEHVFGYPKHGFRIRIGGMQMFVNAAHRLKHERLPFDSSFFVSGLNTQIISSIKSNDNLQVKSIDDNLQKN